MTTKAESHTPVSVADWFPRFVFEVFRANGMRFCVLRWECSHPGDSRDIDVFVAGEALPRATRLLAEAARTRGGVIINRATSPGRAQLRVAFAGSDAEERNSVEFDLQTVVADAGVVLMSAEELLHDVEVAEGIPFPTPPNRAALLVLRSLLKLRVLSEAERDFVCQEAQTNGSQFGAALARIVGTSASEDLAARLRRNERVEGPERRSEVVRARVGVDRAARVPKTRSFGERLWRRTKWICAPPGTFVCLLGTDGAGKTTVARGLVKMLRAAPYPVRYVYCGDARAPSRRVKEPTSAEHIAANIKVGLKKWMQSCRLVRTSWVMIRVLLRLPREVFGYIIRVRPILAANGVVIGDRFYFDILANLVEELPPWFLVTIINLLPIPNLAIHLVNTPETILRRKQERTLPEIRQAIDRINKLSRWIPNWELKWTDAPPCQIVLEITNEITAIRENADQSERREEFQNPR